MYPHSLLSNPSAFGQHIFTKNFTVSLAQVIFADFSLRDAQVMAGSEASWANQPITCRRILDD